MAKSTLVRSRVMGKKLVLSLPTATPIQTWVCDLDTINRASFAISPVETADRVLATTAPKTTQSVEENLGVEQTPEEILETWALYFVGDTADGEANDLVGTFVSKQSAKDVLDELTRSIYAPWKLEDSMAPLFTTKNAMRFIAFVLMFLTMQIVVGLIFLLNPSSSGSSSVAPSPSSLSSSSSGLDPQSLERLQSMLGAAGGGSPSGLSNGMGGELLTGDSQSGAPFSASGSFKDARPTPDGVSVSADDFLIPPPAE